MSDSPASGVAGEVGEPLTVQVKVVVPAAEFTLTLAIANSPSYCGLRGPADVDLFAVQEGRCSRRSA